MSHIKPIGKKYKIDKNNNIVCFQHVKNTQNKWFEAAELISKEHTEVWGEHIHSIYVRGSVAQGTAIDYFSDIDIIVVHKDISNEMKKHHVYSVQPKMEYWIRRKYPFVNMLDFNFINYDDIDNKERFILKHLSIFLHGENLQLNIKPFKTSNYPIDNNPPFDKEEWFNTSIIRYIFTTIINKINFYSNDLYYQVQLISKQYPSMKNDLNLMLENIIKNKRSKSNIKEFLDKWKETLDT